MVPKTSAQNAAPSPKSESVEEATAKATSGPRRSGPFMTCSRA